MKIFLTLLLSLNFLFAKIEIIAKIPEASGICYSTKSNTLFVVNDEGTIYEIDDNGEVVDSTIVNYAVDTTISLTKTDEVSYFLEDITFGLVKQYFDGEDMVGTDIDRSVCNFSYDKPIDVDPDVKAYFKCVGVIERSGEIKFDWSIFVSSLEDVSLGVYKGTSTLTAIE